MKCVILDGFWHDDKQLACKCLEGLGLEIQWYDVTTAAQLRERAADAEILIDNKVIIGEEQLSFLPKLRYVGVSATGFNIIDGAACRKRGITVTNVPAYSTDSVAQLVFAFILDHCQHVALHGDAVRNGEWAALPYFSFWKTPLHELAGKTIGIVGLGRIGQKVAEIAHAFGMNILGTSRSAKTDIPSYIRQVQLDTLLRESDFVSLHCPLTPQSKHLINADTLALMKPSAMLINTSRGPVVDAAAVADALRIGKLAAAAADVLDNEPPSAEDPLVNAPNSVITPHFAWATLEARERLFNVIIGNLKAFLDGTPINVVNP